MVQTDTPTRNFWLVTRRTRNIGQGLVSPPCFLEAPFLSASRPSSAPGFPGVVLTTPPRSMHEWAVGLISTVVTGIGGGAIAVQYFRLQEWVDSVTGLVALGGLIFGCGLPG